MTSPALLSAAPVPIWIFDRSTGALMVTFAPAPARAPPVPDGQRGVISKSLIRQDIK